MIAFFETNFIQCHLFPIFNHNDVVAKRRFRCLEHGFINSAGRQIKGNVLEFRDHGSFGHPAQASTGFGFILRVFFSDLFVISITD